MSLTLCLVRMGYPLPTNLTHQVLYDKYLSSDDDDDTKTSQTVRISHLDTHTEQISLLNVKHENLFFIT